MNIEVETLKKDMEQLKKDMSVLREYITMKDTREYFKITYVIEDAGDFDLNAFIKPLNVAIPINSVYYAHTKALLDTYCSPLLPHLHLYKNTVVIYFHTVKPILCTELEKYFKQMPGKTVFYYYSTQNDFDIRMDREINLKNYPITHANPLFNALV